MDTLVFLCQHTCTMVLPRGAAGLSGNVLTAGASSSDSASAEESSEHSGKVRRLLLLDNEQSGEGGGKEAKTDSVRLFGNWTSGFIFKTHNSRVFDNSRVLFKSSLTAVCQVAGQRLR